MRPDPRTRRSCAAAWTAAIAFAVAACRPDGAASPAGTADPAAGSGGSPPAQQTPATGAAAPPAGQAPTESASEPVVPSGPPPVPFVVDEAARQAGDPAEWVPLASYDGLAVETRREFDRDGTQLMRIHTVARHPETGAEVAHGPDWAYFETGFPARVEHHRLGARHGRVELWWATGQRREEGTFADGVRVGALRRYSKQGKLLEEGAYLAGERHGPHRKWYAEGTPEEEAEYDRGRLVGRHRQFGRQGQVLLDERHLDGALHGPWSDHYPESGALRRFGEYDRGQRVGVWRVAREDAGGLLLEEHYAAGALHGLQREWNDAGVIIAETTFEAGVKTGPARTWFADGTPQSSGRLAAGLREGPWQYWGPDGRVNERWTGTYETDRRVDG